jgi:hypothetical protein
VKGVRPDKISEKDQLDAAVEGLAHLIRSSARR